MGKDRQHSTREDEEEKVSKMLGFARRIGATKRRVQYLEHSKEAIRDGIRMPSRG